MPPGRQINQPPPGYTGEIPWNQLTGPQREAAVSHSMRMHEQPTPVDDPGDPSGGPYITPDIPDVEPPPVVVETGGNPQSKGEFGQVEPGGQPRVGRGSDVGPSHDQPHVDTSQTMEARLAADTERGIADSHEDQRLQQEASELYEQGQAQQSDDVQRIAEGLEDTAPSGWDNAIEGLFGEGGEMHQALRAVEDATDGLITVPGAPGAGFGTDEYWGQVGFNALIAASMEAAVPLVVAGVPMAVRKGAYILRTPRATRQAAGELRTAANEAHSATLQYQRLRGGRGTENLLRTERAGSLPTGTPPGMHPAQAVRTPTGQMGPMSAETSAAYQQMTSAHRNLARAVDRVDGLPPGFTLSNNRWMGVADDLMLHRGGNPVYYARPGVREVLTRSPGSRSMLENMPRPPSSLSSSQATSRLDAAFDRMLLERARHQQVVSGFDRSVGPYVSPTMRGGKPGTPATTTLPTSPPPSRQLSYRHVAPAEREGGYRMYDWTGRGQAGRTGPLTKTEEIYSYPGYSETLRPGAMQRHEQFVQRSYEQYRRAAQEYDDLVGASGRLSEGREAAEGLRLLQTTLGKK